MKLRQPRMSVFASAAITVASAWITSVAAAPVIFNGSGANPAAIQGTVDAFRAALGDPNNGNTPWRHCPAGGARSIGMAAVPRHRRLGPGHAFHRLSKHPGRDVHNGWHRFDAGCPYRRPTQP